MGNVGSIGFVKDNFACDDKQNFLVFRRIFFYTLFNSEPSDIQKW
jgi:hypothetical protein